ncbi:protein of unknown function DUF968 [Vibrio phage 1.091.O._10N.286.52.B12]|nr:protein of unknown function DUF968 [Vibrio phage 1.091.O._10N.286.52.B12]
MASRVYRNKKIGEFIRSGEVACCITGSTYAVVNHHLIGHGYSAMGSKSPDWAQIALTHDLHSELHDKGWKAFEDKYGRTQKSMVAETMGLLHAMDVIDLNIIDLEHGTPDWLTEEMEKLTHE